MRAELKLQKMVRIRTGTVRTNSGSVSPPAPLIKASENGKTTFFEKMRVTYGKESNLSQEELEKKIEVLWQALSDENKEKFIRLASLNEKSKIQKENITSNTPKSEKRSVTPVDPIKQKSKLERQKNCKEIAKVLDLCSKGSKRASFTDTVKRKMRAYAAEASLAADSRFSTTLPPPRQPSEVATSQLDFECPELEPNVQLPEDEMLLSSQSDNKSSLPQTAPNIVLPNTLKIPPSRCSKSPSPFLKPLRAPKKFQPVRPPPIRVQVTKITYREACDKYYELLSQACLHNNDAPSQIQPYAQIVEGCFVAREYTYQDVL